MNLLAAASFAAANDLDHGISELPSRGICAHRGASDTHPENTLAALREAVRLGAHMVEFDVAFTKDHALVLMHDETINRTTNGAGRLSDLTLAEVQRFDAGSWKHPRFRGEKIPTLDEALTGMPENVWLNVHVKGDGQIAAETARRIATHDRLHQAFIACGKKAAQAARQVEKRIRICNMDRRANVEDYVAETIEARAEFIQLLGVNPIGRALIERLQQHKVRINCCCTNDADALKALFAAGVEFPLVDRVDEMLRAAERRGIARLAPVNRAKRSLRQ